MTSREEQIIDAGIEYTISTGRACIGGSNFTDVIRELNRNRAFEAGAKWADEHSKNN